VRGVEILVDWWKNFWDESYLHELVSRQGRTKREINFVEKAMRPKKRGKLLDLGCGIGRHSIELAKRGYNVLGLDYSSVYLNYARKKSVKTKNVKFVRLDMRKINFRKKFDSVINMYTSFGYFSDEENVDVIKKVSVALKRGGKFLIDVVNRDAILKNFRKNLRKRTPYGVMVHESDFDYSTSRMNSRWKFYRGNKVVKRGTTSLRMYSFHELKNILEESGLKVVGSYGGFGNSSIDSDSPRMVLICKKI
jgi:SAM-dependent methyltransferase